MKPINLRKSLDHMTGKKIINHIIMDSSFQEIEHITRHTLWMKIDAHLNYELSVKFGQKVLEGCYLSTEEITFG